MSALTRSIGALFGVASASYGAYVAATWWRYGRGTPSKNPLLDRFLPSPEIDEVHAIEVAAPVEVTMAAAREMPLDRSRIVRAIFRAREQILRARPDAPAMPATGIVAATTAIGWGALVDEPDQLVMGAVTRPWEPSPTFRALPPDQFAAFAEPDYVKILWTLRAEPTPTGSRLITETRAIATDAGARTKFRRYWSLLSPGIKLIRAMHLPLVKREAEHRAHPLPGDDLIPDPRAELNHAIDIDAPPRDVWPWLVQMGCQRGGWYSWDALDNGGQRSATQIVPELQNLMVGDVLPYRPSGDEGFEVLDIEHERALILGTISPEFAGTWAFVLEPLDGGRRTRLITRYRAAYEPGLRRTAFFTSMRALHTFMERKQLRTIKHHAEHLN
jgi:hypothetical protein